MTALRLIFFRLFSVHAHEKSCNEARVKLDAASARLATAKKEAEEARQDIRDALDMNEASECERQAVQQKFRDDVSSGLHDSVKGDDASE